MFQVFSYGTLALEWVQIKLFGHALVMVDAHLEGYLIAQSGNYLGIAPVEGGVVPGKLLKMSLEDLLIADQWEEVPYYYKQKCNASVGQNRVEAFVYIKSKDFDTGAPVSESELKDAVEGFVSSRDTSVPPSDIYFVCPVRAHDFIPIIPPQKQFIGEQFVQTYSAVVSEEYDHTHLNPPHHLCLGDAKLSVAGKSAVVLLYLGLATIEQESYGTLYISVLVSSISPIDLWAHIYCGDFGLNGCSLQAFLTRIPRKSGALEKIGAFKCVCFPNSEWGAGHKIALFAAEHTHAKIRGSMLQAILDTSLAQYTTASVYANEIAIIETPVHYNPVYLSRMRQHILTLFIVELFIIQTAISIETHSKLLRIITTQKTCYVDSQLHKTMLMDYWNPECFLYPTARQLMSGLGGAMRIERIQATQVENQRLLSQTLPTMEEEQKEKKLQRTEPHPAFLNLGKYISSDNRYTA